MEITDFSQGQIWGIYPDKLEVLTKKFKDFTSESLAIEAASYRADPNSDPPPYDIVDGVAVIPISGPLSKRDTFFSYLFGGSSVVSISRALTAAVNDSQVKAIILSIDSPGGVVSVVESLTEAVRMAGEQKPIVSFANGMMASAAYWIGSSASKIVAENTAEVGSIGVVMVHYDFSEMDRQMGIKRTYISAGKYKAMGNSSEPLSPETRAIFEEQLNQYYTLFVDTIAENRGVEAQEVLEKMADGRIFIGKQAVEAGLVDQVGTLSTTINMALAMVSGSLPQRSYNQGGTPRKEKSMDKIINTEQLTAAYPELVNQIKEAAINGVKVEAVNGERLRITGLVSIQFGAEAGDKFKKLVETGTTVEQFQAYRELNPVAAKEDDAEKKAREVALAAIKAAGPDNPGSGAGAGTAGEKDFTTMVSEYQLLHKVTKGAAIEAVQALYPEAHEKWLVSVQKK